MWEAIMGGVRIRRGEVFASRMRKSRETNKKKKLRGCRKYRDRQQKKKKTKKKKKKIEKKRGSESFGSYLRFF